MLLKVTNKGAEFTSRYDGVNYSFEQNKTITISADAARHIFGVGLADKTEVLSRHGWLQTSGGMEQAMERLNEFSFAVVNDNPEAEPVVSFTTAAVEETEQGSAPLHSEAGAEDELPDGGSEQAPAEVLAEGGSLLDNIPSFGK